jgi:molybdenum cofactor cytidylyltransferase
MLKISAIVLASGKAERFASNKLLYKANGKPVISYVIDNVSKSNFYERIIVLRSKEIEEYAKPQKYKIVRNDDFEDGMSTSIVHGIENVAPESQAAMIIPGDMPHLDPISLNSLMKHYEISGKGIGVFLLNGTIISPVIFSRKYFGELTGIRGDKGGKSIIMMHPDDFSGLEVKEEILMDIDTVEDALKFEKLVKHKN